MKSWPDRRLLDLLGVDHPILLGPLAGCGTPALAIAVSDAGGLGSLPCALLSLDQARAGMESIRAATNRPVNLNFFAHQPPKPDPARMMAWRARLAPYAVEVGIDPEAPIPASGRNPFDAAYCALVEEFRPAVVSFHFGLPDEALLDRVKATGAKVIGCATTVAEAVWLERRGVDAIVAMGLEAGGHRGMFLSDDLSSQVGTFALVPQVVDAVSVPVIAAGAVADARGIVAALALGAAGVQMGSAYLLCPETSTAPLHRKALEGAADDNTAVTNLFTGRPARGLMNRVMREVGPISPLTPSFPLAGGALAPLRAKAEAAGSADFTNLWAGQAARYAQAIPAGELTKQLAEQALLKLGALR